MKKALLVSLAVCLGVVSFAEPAGKPLKVLMIGNSFSKCVLHYTPKVASVLGCELDITSLYIPGCPLSRHAKNLTATNFPYSVMVNYGGKTLRDIQPFPEDKVQIHRAKNGRLTGVSGNLRDMLAADRWDIVTIQQASHESWKPETYHPHVDEVVAAIRELAPQAQIRIQQTWSYCKADRRICNRDTMGPGSWKLDQAGMYEALTTNYVALARELGAKIIPMGLAVQRYREAAGIDDYVGDVVGNIKSSGAKVSGDTIHLNGKGQYLQALVWVGALFDVDVSRCAYKPAGIDDETAAALRAAAAAALQE